jgi:arginase family enzyme
MPSFEVSMVMNEHPMVLNRQGVPTFLGSRPIADLDGVKGADVAIVGVPFVSPLIGYENDVAPRKVRIAGLFYGGGSYLPDLDIDPAEHLNIVDYGDVDFPFGDTAAAMAAVEQTIGGVVDRGAMPVTIGGNAPASSYAVLKAITERAQGMIGMISFDGHTDTMADYGDEPNSSNWVRASYLKLDKILPTSHAQIGMRGMLNRRADMAFFRERSMRLIMSRDVREMTPRQLAQEAVSTATAGTDHIWLAVDLDVLDFCHLPEWDWPDPCGVDPAHVLETAYAAGKTGKLCGVSLMMIGGVIPSALRIATWIVLYALAGHAEAKRGR